MNLIEKDITMKYLLVVEGDTIVTVEVLAIEANTVGTTTRITIEDTGANINVDMTILTIGKRIHLKTGEENTTMIMSQDQDHQHTLDIKLTKKTVWVEEGAIEIHLDDQGRRGQDITHLMMETDTKNIVAHIVNKTPLERRNQQEIEVPITWKTTPKNTEIKMTIALRIKKVDL